MAAAEQITGTVAQTYDEILETVYCNLGISAEFARGVQAKAATYKLGQRATELLVAELGFFGVESDGQPSQLQSNKHTPKYLEGYADAANMFFADAADLLYNRLGDCGATTKLQTLHQPLSKAGAAQTQTN